MRKIAHIINPVIVNESSDLFIAQPITFETMRIAQEFARGHVDVALYSAQYPEDRPIIPEWFQMTPDLDRSILDIGSFHKKRKLPLIKDVLDRLYQYSEDADYLIYTNVDIAVMPYFYCTIADIIASGVDDMVINRRTISDRYKKTSEIHSMYAKIGESHPGHDCFVFKKSVYRDFILHDACIGTNWIGKILVANLIYHSFNFKEISDLHLTFHIGDNRGWKRPEFSDYDQHNEKILVEILQNYRDNKNFSKNSIIRNQIKRLGMIVESENTNNRRSTKYSIRSLLQGLIFYLRSFHNKMTH